VVEASEAGPDDGREESGVTSGDGLGEARPVRRRAVEDGRRDAVAEEATDVVAASGAVVHVDLVQEIQTAFPVG
jgi:hypothetical protein